MDAANLLKPMLARGELRMIGATTLTEYREHVEKDAAFERRFQQVRARAGLAACPLRFSCVPHPPLSRLAEGFSRGWSCSVAG